MVICAEAGLSLDATLVRVSRELGNTWPELAEELAITAAELTFLPERRMAFENLNARTDSDGIRGVVNTLQQRFADKSNVNIDQEMANLMKLQTAYGANARVLSVAKDMLDQLFQVV